MNAGLWIFVGCVVILVICAAIECNEQGLKKLRATKGEKLRAAVIEVSIRVAKTCPDDMNAHNRIITAAGFLREDEDEWLLVRTLNDRFEAGFLNVQSAHRQCDLKCGVPLTNDAHVPEGAGTRRTTEHTCGNAAQPALAVMMFSGS